MSSTNHEMLTVHPWVVDKLNWNNLLQTPGAIVLIEGRIEIGEKYTGFILKGVKSFYDKIKL